MAAFRCLIATFDQRLSATLDDWPSAFDIDAAALIPTA
jgi:hypothetical protein